VTHVVETAFQAQSPEFKIQSHQEKRKSTNVGECGTRVKNSYTLFMGIQISATTNML
jgi:hypothetical protein